MEEINIYFKEKGEELHLMHSKALKGIFVKFYVMNILNLKESF